MNETITKFLDERKELWLKSKIKPSMQEDEVLELHEECNKVFSLELWLPNASQRAGQISISTHPCTFSHPSARKNKNGDVTPIIADVEKRADGLLRSGNVEVKRDALGNAAALDVHKFLNLIMPDGKELIWHIEQNSDLAKSILKIKSKSYENLREEFLEMIGSSGELVTSSKIKQVYFPVADTYHQLSILSNSGIIFELRKRLDAIRFGEALKELRKLRRDNIFSEEGYREIYNLTVMAYGGTQPQNISVLNSQNAGKAQLLYSMPPQLKKQDIRFPKKNFFSDSLNPWKFKYIFDALHNIFKVPNYSNVTMREARTKHYAKLVEKIIEQMWSVREVEQEQYFEKTSKLKTTQKIWLLSEFELKRDEEDTWLDEVIEEITHWVLSSYKKVLKKSAIEINGTEELKDIRKIVEEHKEGLR